MSSPGRTLRRALLLTAAWLALLPPRGASGLAPAGIDWVRIPAGSFLMGSRAGQDALPIHRVAVGTFEMSRSEVTFGQYRACVAAGGCAPVRPCLPSLPMGDGLPAVCVSWLEASAFARWAGGRLPSEAEWEYAARGAGRGEPVCSSLPRACAGGAVACDRPVCAHPETDTAQGLCDMTGDDWEWVQDWYHDSFAGAPSDGAAWEKPATATRVSRLGSWDACLGEKSPNSRDDDPPGFRHPLLGFRVAR